MIDAPPRDDLKEGSGDEAHGSSSTDERAEDQAPESDNGNSVVLSTKKRSSQQSDAKFIP
jgi:hypothetical protein